MNRESKIIPLAVVVERKIDKTSFEIGIFGREPKLTKETPELIRSVIHNFPQVMINMIKKTQDIDEDNIIDFLISEFHWNLFLSPKKIIFSERKIEEIAASLFVTDIAPHVYQFENKRECNEIPILEKAFYIPPCVFSPSQQFEKVPA